MKDHFLSYWAPPPNSAFIYLYFISEPHQLSHHKHCHHRHQNHHCKNVNTKTSATNSCLVERESGWLTLAQTHTRCRGIHFILAFVESAKRLLMQAGNLTNFTSYLHSGHKYGDHKLVTTSMVIISIVITCITAVCCWDSTIQTSVLFPLSIVSCNNSWIAKMSLQELVDL